MRCDAPTARVVHASLTSVIAGHAQATTTYRFYEEIDHWLGPWGKGGYPIGYGKFYAILFTTNEKLSRNPHTKKWVWQTLIQLQEALRDFVVRKIQTCTIQSLTEPELRSAAFQSHAKAYQKGGLAMVALVAPELIPIIATIPWAEFIPGSKNFGSTIAQVFETLARILPYMAGNGLGALAGPAHNGNLRRAFLRDQRRFFNEQAIVRELSGIKAAIERGDLDHIPWLDKIIAQLNARQFPNQGFARAARQVVTAAQRRRRIVTQQLNSWLENSPEVKKRVVKQTASGARR